jgi:hypothetical protein
MWAINRKGEKMKAKELAEKLMENPEFEVDFGIFEPDGSDYGMGLRTFKITGIADIGYSDKVIKLDGAEK